MTENKDSQDAFAQILFPFDSIRSEQDALIAKVSSCIAEKKHLVVHAPTGLGKTIASLGPALKYAIDNKKTVFFLTSRHTQHIIAVDTLKAIKEKFEIEFSSSDIIGKKHMCIFPGIEKMASGEFAEYCRHLREEDSCEFYINFKKNNKITVKAKKVADELKKTINHTDRIIEASAADKLCPYEMASFMGRDAKVIIADYYYIFNPAVRDSFFRRIEKSLEDCIIIVDEAHNLPGRLRELMTSNLTSFMLKRGILEAKKLHQETSMSYLVQLQDVMNSLSAGMKGEIGEKLASREDFLNKVKRIDDYEKIIEELEISADHARERQRYSFMGSIAKFLESWTTENEGFVRIMSIGKFMDEPYVKLSLKCLDPSLVTKEIVQDAHSVICMSGTLTPTEMYADLLGFDARTEKAEFTSPFSKDNVLRLVVPDVTTKYTSRNEAQFAKIGKICSEIAESVPGNIAYFFPSYSMRDTIAKYMSKNVKKKIFSEDPRMNKQQRHEFLEKFKQMSVDKAKDKKNDSAILLAAATGSFGEGIDLPGDYLKGVVIVGLPLSPPDLETNALIQYYNKKYGKGWDYGYVFPAITKCMQGAGRCIRTETDRGIIAFLDERFAWPHYSRCFPPDYNLKISRDWTADIEEFFKN